MTDNWTPGPWGWFMFGGNRLCLATPDRGRLIVMDFVRQGMQAAQPRFAVWDGQTEGEARERLGGIMCAADEIDLAKHPDATLIAAAPDLVAALRDLVREVDAPVRDVTMIRLRLRQARNALQKAGALEP